MPDFSQRSQDEEIMDDLQCSGEVVYQTLRELETINYLLGGNYVTIDGVSRLTESADKNKVITIADLGCGSGDILKLIRQWGTRKQIKLDLTGIDANPHITGYAKDHTSGFPLIRYEAVDIFSEEFKRKEFDIVIGTLFFHHFSSEQLVNFFSHLKNKVRLGIVINDIHRHWFAYYSIRWLTKLFSRSSMVKFDAPLSVRRAFKKVELKGILERSGIVHYSIRWMWAFRWQVVIYSEKP